MKRNLFILSSVCLLGLINTGFSQTSWNAFNDFYLNVNQSGVNYGDGTSIATIDGYTGGAVPTSPSATGAAWSYDLANINGSGGFPGGIPSLNNNSGNASSYGPVFLSNPSANGGLTSMEGGNFLTFGQASIGGSGNGGYFAGYAGGNNGSYPWLGKYNSEWFSASPNAQNGANVGIGNNNSLLWLQGAAFSPTPEDGIIPVLVWTAPVTGTYAFSGVYTTGSAGGDPTDLAIVDQSGNVLLQENQLPIFTLPTAYSFNDTLQAGQSVQFQAGGGHIGAAYPGGVDESTPLGLSVEVAALTTGTFSTSITLGSSENPSVFDDNVTFTATIVPAPNGGTVQFYVNSSPVGSPVAVNTGTGQASLSTGSLITLAVGSNSITAIYSGITNNSLIFSASSTASTLTENVVNNLNWNAYNDFYFDSTSYAHNGGSWGGATSPSTTGKAWGYYDANCNYSGGYPGSIGSYFGPGDVTASNEVLMAMANYQPLGIGQEQIAGNYGNDAFDITGGTGFARYVDNQGWSTELGSYDGAWFPAAPGYGTAHASDPGLIMIPSWLGVAQGEGICSVVTWTAPVSGTYSFTGDFLIGTNSVSGPGGGQASSDYAIVDSLGGIEAARTVVAQGTYNPFNFQETFSAGDVVEFQVGTDYQPGAAVGFNCNITNIPLPAVLVSATRTFANPTQVSAKFNAPLYAPSVGNLANYSINSGVTITAAQLSPIDPTTIIMTVNPGLNYPATLTVNGVENNYGQLPVTANSMALISVPIYMPNGFGTPTNGAQDTFSSPTLGTNWVSGDVYDEGDLLSESNYYYTQVFVQTNGVLHVHADSRNLNAEGYIPDPNYLVYVDPAYESSVQEALIHITIKASNFSPSDDGIAGVGVCVPEDPYISSPEGGDCLRAVNAGYDDVTNYPFFLACSDYVTDNDPPAGVGDVYNIQWKVGGSYWLRIRQDIDTNPATDSNPGGIISTKVWAGDGSEAEPSNWQSVWKDPLPAGDVTRSGYAAIRAGWGLGVDMDFDVDYFLVSAAGLPTITPTLPPSLAPGLDLEIAIDGGNAMVSWPAAVQASYTLQSSSSLSSGVWSNVGAAVVVNGLENSVTVPLNGQQLFFRLAQQ
jgi:hypothetical protein